MLKASKFNEYKTKNDIDVYINNTDKFKTNYIQIDIIRPLNDEKDVSKNALIPYVLYRGTDQYPTNQDISKRLDELYGADLNVSVARRGENQLLRFSIEVINDKFVNNNENLLKGAIDFLYEILFNPLLEDGDYKQKFINKGHKFLKEKILSLKNDKNSYVIERCYQEMCRGEDFSLYTLGTLKGLKSSINDNLYQYFKKVLIESPLEIFVIGDVGNHKDIYDYINTKFDYERNKDLPINNTSLKIDGFDNIDIEEEDQVTQSKLCAGIRVPITRNHPLYFALIVFNGMLGGFSHSKLFTTVREERGLAYYINTRLESTKGLILINAGIDIKDYQTVKDIISEKLNEMSKGQFTDKNLNWTKKKLINRYKSLSDNNHSVVDAFLLGLINDKKDSLNYVINSIKEVDKKDIIEVAKKVNLTTHFLLKPGSA